MHHISCRARNWSTVSGQASQSVTFVDVNRKTNDEIDHSSFQLASLIPEKWRLLSAEMEECVAACNRFLRCFGQNLFHLLPDVIGISCIQEMTYGYL